MKTRTGGWLLATLAMAGAGVAMANEGWGGPPAEMVKRFDKNADGKLDGLERLTAHETMRAEKLKAYDANGNGSLEETERQKLHADRAAERFKALDTNKDGSLSLAEFQAGRPMHGRRGHGRF